MSDKILAKIAAALRLAEKAATEAEAENAMATAQRLATTYSIDLAVARAHQAKAERRSTPTHRTIRIGQRGKKGLHTYITLFNQIADANDVRINIAHDSTFVIAFGFEEDIALAEALYASLVTQMVTASNAYMKAGSYKSEQVWRLVTKRSPWGGPSYRDYDWAPVSGHTARIEFQKAFAYRVGKRLKDAKESAKSEAIEADRQLMQGVDVGSADTERKTGTELAIIAKGVEIADYYKVHSTARGTYKGGRGGGSSADAYRAGRAAGDRARLGGERAIGGSRRELAS